MNKISPGKSLLYLTLFFFLLVFADIPLTVFYTVTRDADLIRILLYASEFIILLIGLYMLFRSLFVPRHDLQPPRFIYLYVGYILLMCLLSLMYVDSYRVLRDSRKFLAPLAPLMIGFYFGLFFRGQQKEYSYRLIKFLTVLSAIGLIEWVWWYLSPGSLGMFYSRFFRVGSYYHEIKHSSSVTEMGILTSALRPGGFIIPTLTKRLTGLYLEPFSAGFNAALAVILIWYNRIAGHCKTRRDTIFLIINIIAVILTTSRSAYLVLIIAALVYWTVHRRFLSFFTSVLFILVLYLLYYDPLVEAISSLDWAGHGNATMSFIAYFLSFNNLLGVGIGAMGKSEIYTDCGYGAIYGQLGIAGIISVLMLYLTVGKKIRSTRENRFFVASILISTFSLLFFAGFPFGYKTFGLIHLCLGFLMGHSHTAIEQSFQPTPAPDNRAFYPKSGCRLPGLPAG